MSGVAHTTLFVAIVLTGLESDPPSATTRTTMSRSVTTASTCPLLTTGTAPVSSACMTRAAACIVSFGDTVLGLGVITSRIFIGNLLHTFRTQNDGRIVQRPSSIVDRPSSGGTGFSPVYFASAKAQLVRA